MSHDLFTFGETMIRFSPPDGLRLEQAPLLNIAVGGSESNVAANLARLGKRAAWFSRVADNPLGAQVINALRQNGVDTRTVIRAPDERQGIYYIETGEPPRGTRVWYDRAESAFSRLTPDQLPHEALQAARWFHATGITPALSATCRATLSAAIASARAAVPPPIRSLDVNYRALLWGPRHATPHLDALCPDFDYVFIALRDAALLFGAPNDAPRAARALHARWGRYPTVIVTDGANGAHAASATDTAHTDAFAVSIRDRIGAGDAFVAGVICRLLEDAPLSDALRFGAALAALKLTIRGDIALVSRDEVEAVLAGDHRALAR